MRSLILALVAFFGFELAQAEVEFQKVHSQIQSPDEATLIILKLENGKTAFWDTETVASVTPQQVAAHDGIIQIGLNDEQEVESLSLMESFVPVRRTSLPAASPIAEEQTYQPSILVNYATAQEVLNSFNTNTADNAECYDKAHRWVYDEYVSYSTKLMKVFLFFSDSYIARYKFKWWFHAAPFTYLRMNNVTTERVLDPTFSAYPLKFKLWTDIFMENKVECRNITRYSQYVNDLGTDCFLHRATMYFWQPKDLDAFEETGVQKTSFIPWEIDWAYEHGFGTRRP